MRLQSLLSLCFVAAMAVCPWAVSAQPFPARPVKLIAPVPPGGGTDMVARLVGAAAAEALGQQILVENRPGATGNIGTVAVAKSPPDGYTLLMCSFGNCAVNPSLYESTGYDLFKDLAPVVLIGSSINVLVVGKDTGINSVQDLLARARGGRISYGSSGVGASNHLGAELLKKVSGVPMEHIPYRGSAPAITDLLGGQIQVFFDNEPSILPFIKSNRVRALAVTGKKRSPNLPDLPTMEELGFAGFVIEPWFGITAPAGTPPAVIARLNAALNSGIQRDTVRKSMLEAGITPIGGTPESLGEHMRREFDRWGALIRSQGIKAE